MSCCTLDDGARQERIAAWQSLAARGQAERTARNLSLRLPRELGDEACDLAARERECCPFLEIRVALDAGDVVVAIAAPPDSAGVLDELVAA